MLGERIKSRLQELGLAQKDLALQLNISPSTLSGYITGYRTPDINTISIIAGALKVKPSYLIDEDQNTTSPSLSSQDKKDIAKDLEKFKNELLNSDELMFDGHPMSEDSINNILSALEIGMEQVRRKNKAQYNPQKNKNEQKHIKF